MLRTEKVADILNDEGFDVRLVMEVPGYMVTCRTCQRVKTVTLLHFIDETFLVDMLVHRFEHNEDLIP